MLQDPTGLSAFFYHHPVEALKGNVLLSERFSLPCQRVYLFELFLHEEYAVLGDITSGQCCLIVPLTLCFSAEVDKGSLLKSPVC